MLNKKIVRFATLVFALAIFPVAIFSSDIVSEAESIINKTNDLYNKGNYKASVKSINRALDLYEENTVPDGLYLMAEAVYYAWLNDIYKNIVNNKYDDFHKAVIQISLHSEIISPRSFSLINKIYDSEEEYLKGMRKASLNSERDNSWNKINAKIKLLEENRNDLKKVISGSQTFRCISVIIIKTGHDWTRSLTWIKEYKSRPSAIYSLHFSFLAAPMLPGN